MKKPSKGKRKNCAAASVRMNSMEMELNRRVFLAVLGATTAVAAAEWKRCTPARRMPVPGGICFFAEARGEPVALPRTLAIVYLPVEPESYA